MSDDDLTNPRRLDVERMTPAEKAIQDAIGAVEAAGADQRLTRAVEKLVEARDLVADFVDGVGAARLPAHPIEHYDR